MHPISVEKSLPNTPALDEYATRLFLVLNKPKTNCPSQFQPVAGIEVRRHSREEPQQVQGLPTRVPYTISRENDTEIERDTSQRKDAVLNFRHFVQHFF